MNRFAPGDPRRATLARALLYITPAMWSANFIVARMAVGVVEPHLLALLRWSMASAMMLPLAWPALRRHWPQWRREWKDLLLMGAFGMWICGAFVYIGAASTSATNIGLLYAAAPVLIAVGSALWLGERLSKRQIAGVALALTGTTMIVVKGSLDNLLAFRLNVGDLWIVASVLSWAAYSLMLRARASVLDSFARLTAIAIGGVIVLIPFTIAEMALTGAPRPSVAMFTLAFVAALLPGFLSYQAYSFMQRELGVARTALVMYLSPIYAAFVAWAILGEAPQWFHGAGALLILPGSYLATRTPAKITPRG